MHVYTHIHTHTAALRTAYELVAKAPLPKLDFESVRGLDGVKSASVSIPNPTGGEPTVSLSYY